MASLWRQFKGDAPKKLLGNLTMAGAQSAMTDYAKRWTSVEKKTKVDPSPQNGMEILLYRQGALVGIAWIEPISPPTKPDPGDSRVSIGSAA